MPYDLYVVTDEKLRKGLTHRQIAKDAVSGGADVIQLRDKEMKGRELLLVAREIREITRVAGYFVYCKRPGRYCHGFRCGRSTPGTG